MKLFTTLLVFVVCFSTYVNAQKVDCKLLINKNQSKKVDLQEPFVVNLFKDFKINKYDIAFSFEGENYSNSKRGPGRVMRSKSEKPEFSFFRFRTTVRHNGKTIGTNERRPMPYIPGDMFLPAEAFDFIPILSSYQQNGFSYNKNSGKLPPGEYEIILEALPVEVKGSISSAQLNFKI